MNPDSLSGSANPNLYLAGALPFGAIDSPSDLGMYRVVLRDGANRLPLQQALCVVDVPGFTADGAPLTRRVLAQVRGLGLKNQHHETPLLQAHLRAHGAIPGLSGRADHLQAEVYAVDAVELGNEGQVLAKVSPRSALPPTGTDVSLADNKAVRQFIARGTPALLNVGRLPGETNLPLSLPHHDLGDDGVGEGRHMGIFGPSGSGKTVMLGQLMTGWARHRQMGQLVLDHDGDLSALKIGADEQGKPHFDLGRALVAAGRDLTTELLRVNVSQLRVERHRDLASALRQLRFFEDLGIGAGEKMNACEQKLGSYLRERLGIDRSFADLEYPDTIDEVCDVLSEAYATGKKTGSGTDRDKKKASLLETAHGRMSGALRRKWEQVQDYARRPYCVRELVETALFDGKVVIVGLGGASGAFDEMMLKRVVQTMLDIAKVSYLLKVDRRNRDVWARYGYLQRHFNRYEREQVNAMSVIDEAHLVASEEQASNERSVAADLRLAIRHTRKYRLGFCFATQQIRSIDKRIFDGLQSYLFAYGLKTSSERERVKEVLSEPSALDLYLNLPDPKASGQYSFAIAGAALPLANGAALSIRAYRTQDAFFGANPRLADSGPMAEPPTSARPALSTAVVEGLEDLDG